MKQKLSFVVSLWWVILCTLAGMFLLLLSEKQSRPSDTENRMLAGFPSLTPASLLSGEFMDGFESFLSDGFFARTDVIDASEILMDRFSVLSEEEKIIIESEEMERRLESEAVPTDPVMEPLEDDSPVAELPEADIDAMDDIALDDTAMDDDAPVDETEPAPVTDIDEDEVSDPDDSEAGFTGDTASDETDDDEEEETVQQAGEIPLNAKYSYLWYDMPDGSYTINYKYENKAIGTYANTLKLMQTYLPEDGVICFTQVPLSSMARRWTSHRNTYVGWGSSVEIVLEKYLENTERIYVFSTYDILEPHMATSSGMFYATDHHWSAEGAYLVFAEMMKRQNLPVIPYDEYEYKAIHGKKTKSGYYDVFNALYPLLPGHSYVIRHVDEAREIDLMNYKSPTYMAFMNNTQLPWRRVVTGANTGRKALVICDSFGNAFTPYLLPYYSEVHMCDFRYNRYSKRAVGGSIGYMIKHYGISDVYIVTSTANGLRKDNSIKYLRQFLVG